MTGQIFSEPCGILMSLNTLVKLESDQSEVNLKIFHQNKKEIYGLLAGKNNLAHRIMLDSTQKRISRLDA